MSVMTTGPPGAATTASSESAGALPPDAVATTTDWPRARPFKTPPGENEATKGFLLANVTVRGVPNRKYVLHTPLFPLVQLIPTGDEVIVPLPAIDTVSSGANATEQFRFWVITSVAEPPLPAQSPPQPAIEKAHPGAVLGESVTEAPLKNLAEHMPLLAAAQLMPTGADVTVPPPRTETVSMKKSCTAASTSTWKVKNVTVLGTLHCHVLPEDTCPVGRISL